MRCYAFDAQNNLAYRTDQLVFLRGGGTFRGPVVGNDENEVVVETLAGRKSIPKANVLQIDNVPVPQALVNGSWHYIFPIFSGRAVSPGSTWAFKIPGIMANADGSIHPGLATVMYTRVSCTLRELRGEVAVIDYKYEGEFDSKGEEFKDRFQEDFGDKHHVIHNITGTGAMSFDTVRGFILEKTEDTRLTVITTHFVPQPENKAPKELHEETITTSTFSMKWLPPGTMLRNRSRVPAFE
jgi:hypothetical protein